jgi:hypothetical protein
MFVRLLHAATGSKGIYDWNLNAPYFSISTPSTARGSRIRRCRHSWNLTALRYVLCPGVVVECHIIAGNLSVMPVEEPFSHNPAWICGRRPMPTIQRQTQIKHVQSIESLDPKPALDTLKRGVAPRPLVTSKVDINSVSIIEAPCISHFIKSILSHIDS